MSSQPREEPNPWSYEAGGGKEMVVVLGYGNARVGAARLWWMRQSFGYDDQCGNERSGGHAER